MNAFDQAFQKAALAALSKLAETSGLTDAQQITRLKELLHGVFLKTR